MGLTRLGQVVVGITDVQGDFAAYWVDVVALTLTKQNGAIVEVLPLTTRIDFSQYVELTELVTAATIPSGKYTKASLVLDYQKADIRVEDASGNPVKVETILDQNGSPISTLTVSVHLEDRNSLVIVPGIPGIEDISLGQYITAFGSLNSEETALDAGEGYVRMHLTTLKGDIARLDSSLYIDLSAINGRDVGLFDFGGTGVDSANDADPAEYEVDAGALDVSGLTAGKPVKCRGFVTDFGHAAASADFEAVAVVDVSNVIGLMVVNWSPSSADAFETITAGGLTINLDGAGDFHRLNRAGVVTDLNGLSKQPEVKAQMTGSGLFVIHQGGSSQLFFSFSGFSDELIQRLNENAGVNLMAARGQFDDTTETLTAHWVFVMLESN
jgi:hypothetical protein